jgi:hypothetical protein
MAGGFLVQTANTVVNDTHLSINTIPHPLLRLVEGDEFDLTGALIYVPALSLSENIYGGETGWDGRPVSGIQSHVPLIPK